MTDNGADHLISENHSSLPIMSIDDINPDVHYEVSIKTLLNSPRTLEACRRQGLDPVELDPVTEDQIRKQIAQRDKSKRQIPKVLIDIRLKHYEDKRRDMIRIIREERWNIIDEAEKGSKILAKRSISGSPGTAQPSRHSPRSNVILGNQSERQSKFINSITSSTPLGNARMSGGMSRMSVNASPIGSSSMIEREKRALEKIKARQRKEVEQMMDYEMQVERIKRINEDKMLKVREKEERRRQEVLVSQKEQEERKHREEERKREKADLELQEQKRRAHDQYRKDQDFQQKQREQDALRKREASLKEEERRKKQEEFQLQTESILIEQAREVQRRKQEMEKRDVERQANQAKVLAERQRAAAQKRLHAEAKIEHTKASAAQELLRQRQEFEERERKANEKLKKFEQERERERVQLTQRSMAKSVEMRQVLEHNNQQLEERKLHIIAAQKHIEQRQSELSKIREQEQEVKKRQLFEKERHSVEVRKVMEKTLQQRVESIKSKAAYRDEAMSRTQTNREWQQMIKHEQELLKREEKWANVQRISRASDYKKQQILEKIEYDNSKTQSLRQEKERLFASRASIRREAEHQKQQIMDTFEKMRKKGKLDRNTLAQFGVNLGGGAPTIQEDPDNETHEDDTRNEQMKNGNNSSVLVTQNNPNDTQ